MERGKYLYREKNYTAASNLFRRAAENGGAEAADYLGVLYEFGQGMPADCKEAKKWFQKGAKENNSSAMDHLGMLFEHGCGVKLDDEQAKRWFDIGWLYQNGWGVPAPDLKEAVRWFRKAAAAKSTLGMNSLGWAYENGLALPNRDYRQALQWFRRAADAGASLGSSWAMNNIGDMYEKGYAGLANTDEAIKLYKKAAENGFELAKSNLERLGIKLREERPCCPVTLNS